MCSEGVKAAESTVDVVADSTCKFNETVGIQPAAIAKSQKMPISPLLSWRPIENNRQVASTIIWGEHPMAPVCQWVYSTSMKSSFKTGEVPELMAGERAGQAAVPGELLAQYQHSDSRFSLSSLTVRFFFSRGRLP